MYAHPLATMHALGSLRKGAGRCPCANSAMNTHPEGETALDGQRISVAEELRSRANAIVGLEQRNWASE